MKNIRMLVLMAGLLAGTISVMVSLGQTAAPPAAPAAMGRTVAATDKPKQAKVTLWQMWVVGGWCMYPIAALSIGGVALCIYGFLNVREDKMVRGDLMPPLHNAIRTLDFRQAHAVCAANPCVLTNILSAGLSRLSGGTLDVRRVEKAMEEAAVEENAAGLQPINVLSIVAQLAPMFGLLGTVSGMIKAFQKIGLGGMGDPEKLANDIGEAMITTAFGLIVGIPIMYAYFHFKGKFIGHMSRASRLLGNLSDDISENIARVQSGEVPVSQVTTPPSPLEAAAQAVAAPAAATPPPGA